MNHHVRSLVATALSAASFVLVHAEGGNLDRPMSIIDEQRVEGAAADLMVSAAARGDFQVVRESLETGIDVDAANADGFTALMWAAGQGRREIVELLLDRGAHVNLGSHDGTTALMSAASQGHIEIVKALLLRGAQIEARRADGRTALIWSAADNQAATVECLLTNGADVNVADARGLTPLILASADPQQEEGHGRTLPVVLMLLNHKARVDQRDKDGSTALMWAARKGDQGVVQALLESGANPNAAAEDGMTPLMHAASGPAAPSIAVALITRHADVNLRARSGQSAVLIAAERRTASMLNVLLAYGANPNLVDSHGRTPLMAAARRGRLQSVEALLQHGADVGVRDAAGRTAFDVAVECRYRQIALVLQNSGTR